MYPLLKMEFNTWRQSTIIRTEKALNTYLPTTRLHPQRLHEAMHYAALGGGKRIRPLLCYAAGETMDASPDALDAVAAAVEMIHVYSLVHDDLPWMDDDPLRHGKPTVHLQFDRATALLVGDALQAQAFIALTAEAIPSSQRAALVRELALASGSLGMAGGQAIDLASMGHSLSPAELETMHRMKTGALLQAAVRMGALCNKAYAGIDTSGCHDAFDQLLNHFDPLHHPLNQYAQAIGLAFQVVDDILDATADSATLGKTAGKDAQQNKPTYISMLGLSASRTLVKQLHAQAREAAEKLGQCARRLAELADFIVERIC